MGPLQIVDRSQQNNVQPQMYNTWKRPYPQFAQVQQPAQVFAYNINL
jgi:hypothetical protein